MEPEHASTPGATRLSRACRTCQLIAAVVYLILYKPPDCVPKLTYITNSCLPQEPRQGKVGAGVCWHGLGLSWKLSWSPNGPVLQEIRACLENRPVYGSLLSEVHHRKNDVYGPVHEPRQARFS